MKHYETTEIKLHCSDISLRAFATMLFNYRYELNRNKSANVIEVNATIRDKITSFKCLFYVTALQIHCNSFAKIDSKKDIVNLLTKTAKNYFSDN
jgi:hypothetical protein